MNYFIKQYKNDQIMVCKNSSGHSDSDIKINVKLQLRKIYITKKYYFNIIDEETARDSLLSVYHVTAYDIIKNQVHYGYFLSKKIKIISRAYN